MEENNKKLGKALFVKNHYYPGKLLHASDFVREQEYGEKKRAFANKKIFGSGIVDGLDVREGQAGDWYVTAGSAIDLSGRLLVLPEETRLDRTLLDDFMEENGRCFVLGARYEEWPLEQERCVLEGKEGEQAARIAEGIAFRAYSLPAWRQLKEEMGRGEKALVQEHVLYEDGEIQLFLKMPKIVPADSMFHVCIEALAAGAGVTNISWRGAARLTGAFFLESGSDGLRLDKGQVSFLGRLGQAWEICTEEGRSLPVLFELNQLELMREGMPLAKIPTIQVAVEVASAYRPAAEKYLWEEGITGGDSMLGELEPDISWVPLACFKVAEDVDGKRHVSILPDGGVRFYTYHPQAEEILRRVAEDYGIVALPFRRVLKKLRPLPPELPFVPSDPPPSVPSPAEPLPIPPQPSTEFPEAFTKLFGGEWEKRIHRGVAVIPVPKRYHKGQVLRSEEISHGFAGEEVFLWCGRLREAEGHIYWERDKKAFFALQGDEELFSGQKGVWKIEKQALRQNVAEGTFQIALTLAKGSRRNRVGEVAVAWIAVKSI